MKVRRLVATLTAGFDNFVNKVENHEAVAESLMADVRSAAARLRIQLARVREQRDRMQAQRRQTQNQCASWQQRALQLRASDPDKALECMRRLARAEQRLGALDSQIAEQDRLAEQLGRSLQEVEARLEALRLRRTALSSRTARAQAVASSSDPGLRVQVDEVFERWEQSVLEQEYSEPGPLGEDLDSFEQSFSNAEADAELRARLDALDRDNAGGAQ
jgi:phage shock protein A